MLRAALMFFVLGLCAMIFGANGIAGLSIEVGKALLFVFFALAAISLLVSLVRGKEPRILP